MSVCFQLTGRYDSALHCWSHHSRQLQFSMPMYPMVFRRLSREHSDNCCRATIQQHQSRIITASLIMQYLASRQHKLRHSAWKHMTSDDSCRDADTSITDRGAIQDFNRSLARGPERSGTEYKNGAEYAQCNPAHQFPNPARP